MPSSRPDPDNLTTARTGVGLIPWVVGVLLLVAGFVPVAGWLLSDARSGPAGIATRAAVEALTGALAIGGLSILLVALGIGSLPSLAAPLRRMEDRGAALLARVPRARWPFVCGLIAFLGAALAGHLLLLGEPTLVDEMSQLADARAIAGLQPAMDAPAAAIRIQNGLMIGDRWVSIYPPGHTWLLAMSLRLGLIGWLGALLWGATVGVSSDLFLCISDERPTAARAAGLILAFSPMGWFIGGGYLSHLSAGLGVAIALWAAARIRWLTDPAAGVARGGGRRNEMLLGVLLGGAAGWAVTARPLTGLVLAVLVPAAWLLVTRGRRCLPGVVGAVAGGLPFAVALAVWNQGRFGSALRFGYDAAFGPAHGLGFHVDPWGNTYGVVEAIGYTFSDLFLLGSALLETPISAVGAIGCLMLVGRQATRRSGTRLALGWIAAALAANAIYWHHGIHFGPRMLFETLPAWALLIAMTAGEALRTTRDGRLGGVLRAGMVAAVAGALFLNLPARLASAAVGADRVAQLPDTEAMAAIPDSTVVFVHGSWASRVSGRLAQAGIRADSIETVLRRNDLCQVDLVARELILGTSAGRRDTLDRLDWAPLPGTPSDLQMVEIGPENRVRVASSGGMPETCLREIRADRMGSLELEAMRWRFSDRGIVWLRDLGPEFNRVVEGALMLMSTETGARPELVEYQAGIELLWGEDPSEG